MGLLGYIIATVAAKSIIKTVGSTTIDVIDATAKKQAEKESAVVKNGKLYVKPTRPSENYLNDNAYDVVQELLGAGFESVTLKPVKKLSERAVKKYGNIKSITINGNSNFLGVRRIPATSHIIINFLDFKDGVSRTVYEKVKKLKTGRIQSIEELEGNPSRGTSQKSSSKSFCPYCGEKIFNEEAKFCSACGKEI